MAPPGNDRRGRKLPSPIGVGCFLPMQWWPAQATNRIVVLGGGGGGARRLSPPVANRRLLAHSGHLGTDGARGDRYRERYPDGILTKEQTSFHR